MRRVAEAACGVVIALAALASCGIPEGVYFRCEDGLRCGPGYRCVDQHCVPEVQPPDPATDGGANDGGVRDAGGGSGQDAGPGATDGGAGVDSGVPVTAVPLTWMDAQPISELNHAAASDRMPTVSADQLKLCFVSSRDGSSTEDIYCALRAQRDAGFGTPSRQDALRPGYNTEDPELSADGLELWLTSPDGGHTDLFHGVITGGGQFDSLSWIPQLAYTWWEAAPSLTGDGRTIYFQSDRTGNSGVDIWYATRTSSTAAFAEPVQLSAVNSAYNDRDPTISPDAGYLLFTSNNRPSPGVSGSVLWIATRQPSGEFASPRAISLEGFNRPVQGLELGADDTLYFQARVSEPSGAWDLYSAKPKYP